MLVLCGALAACSGGKSAEPAATPTTAGAPGAAAGNDADGTITVTIEPVAVQRVDRTVDFVGTLHANAEAEVATEVDGRLLTIGADLGDLVAAGQVLASLDSATLDAQLREAAANLQKSTTDLARARRLKEQGVMSQQEFDTLASARERGAGAPRRARDPPRPHQDPRAVRGTDRQAHGRRRQLRARRHADLRSRRRRSAAPARRGAGAPRGRDQGRAGRARLGRGLSGRGAARPPGAHQRRRRHRRAARSPSRRRCPTPTASSRSASSARRRS